MNIMTKRGSLDNVVVYEHYCDTKADLNNIPKDQITLGSVAVVLKDENNEMGIYIAGSDKQWNAFSTMGGGSSSEEEDEGDKQSIQWVQICDNVNANFSLDSTYNQQAATIVGENVIIVPTEMRSLPYATIRLVIDNMEYQFLTKSRDSYGSVVYESLLLNGQLSTTISVTVQLITSNGSSVIIVRDQRANGGYEEGDTAVISVWIGTLAQVTAV